MYKNINVSAAKYLQYGSSSKSWQNPNGGINSDGTKPVLMALLDDPRGFYDKISLPRWKKWVFFWILMSLFAIILENKKMGGYASLIKHAILKHHTVFVFSPVWPTI